MIAQDSTLRLLVRSVAPLVWRNDRRIAEKLTDFAASEAGSALDMLRAAELCDDPQLRRLFLRHAMDEARHAALFRSHARRISDSADRNGGGASKAAYRASRERRQDLFEDLGLVAFIVFVHLAERRGQAHFASLARHFKDEPRLHALFDEVERDERFHVSYTAKTLKRWRENGRAGEVRRAVWRIRFGGMWSAWRRTGRQTGDRIARAGLALLYVTVVPLFALIAQRKDPDRPGWRTRPAIDAKTLWRQW